MAWFDWIANNLPLFLLLSGTGLIVAEAFMPGAHFIVIGVALVAAGAVGILMPAGLGVLAPVILAAVVLGSGAAALYVYRQFDFYGGKGGEQTTDSESLRGETGRVTERVTPTDGQVKLENGGFNPMYRARSVDGEIAVGSEVIVVDPGGGNVLTVEAFENLDDIDRELARGRDRETSGRDRNRDEEGLDEEGVSADGGSRGTGITERSDESTT